jgi:predicted DNA-binding transcriptional regulator AlpA
VLGLAGRSAGTRSRATRLAEIKQIEDSRRVRLAGIKEIATYYDISPQLAYKWSRRHDFPAPLATLAQGNVWDLDEIERWGTRHGRTKGGGPRRPSAPPKQSAP